MTDIYECIDTSTDVYNASTHAYMYSMHAYARKYVSACIQGGRERARASSLDLDPDPTTCERARAFAGLCDLPLVVDRGERQRGVVRAGNEGDLHRSTLGAR